MDLKLIHTHTHISHSWAKKGIWRIQKWNLQELWNMKLISMYSFIIFFSSSKTCILRTRLICSQKLTCLSRSVVWDSFNCSCRIMVFCSRNCFSTSIWIPIAKSISSTACTSSIAETRPYYSTNWKGSKRTSFFTSASSLSQSTLLGFEDG